MSSIRHFLIVNLLLTATIISLLIVFGNLMLSQNDIQKHLDHQLQQTAYLLYEILEDCYHHHLPGNHIINAKDYQFTHSLNNTLSKAKQPLMFDQYQFLIWNKENLTLKSIHAPLLAKPNQQGFKTMLIHKRKWRIYTYHHKKSTLTITITEPVIIREKLVKSMTHHNILILLLAYPIFGALIWFIVNYSLNSLKKLTNALVKRSATQLDPITDLMRIPIEIQPLIEALNQLFLRLNKAFMRNKQFSADAAHELRTPLAALKTQAQVAIRSITEKERQESLKKVMLGADRCTHIVQQLLALSRLGSENISFDKQKINLTNIAAEIIAQLVPVALEKNIDIEMNQSQKNIQLNGNETAISILIRNLVDNAIRYTPEGGKVTIDVQQQPTYTMLKVTDNGPGIPIALHSRIFERFYRVLGSQSSGSGLGLAIVKQVAQLHHATIKLGTPKSGQGLIIRIIFPKLENSTP